MGAIARGDLHQTCTVHAHDVDVRRESAREHIEREP